ncbi:MAG: molybdopterin molybdotransferase MoeA [Capsulimonadales bacterium]|nr:molybdopterin molybdotransferase MoeA [Capsulimonadales bacterium]
MRSYDEAIERILAQVPEERTLETVPPEQASGRPLGFDVFASVDLPPFDNSAVDGFALNLTASDRRPPGVAFPITRTISAGDPPGSPLAGNEAARILTGAPVPPGCDTIVMVEDTETSPDGSSVLLRDAGSARYIRRKGSDVRQSAPGEVPLLPVGTPLRPGAIGLLAALGRTEVALFARPKIALFSTGDELVPAGTVFLPPGKIRDSNGPALAAAVAEAGGVVTIRQPIADSPEATRTAFDTAADCDLILTSGGVSVGDRDFVKAVAEERGTLVFWRVAIRPGKPLAFGRIGKSLFFGLPGNPVSSLVTFELFVRPVIRRWLGFRDLFRPQVPAVLTADLPHEPGRREFVRATVSWDGGICRATPTGAQGSHRLSTLIDADAFLIAHEDHGDYAAGSELPAMLLL